MHDGIILTILLISLFNVYTLIVCPMSMDVILPFDIDDKTISIRFTVCSKRYIYKIYIKIAYIYECMYVEIGI